MEDTKITAQRADGKKSEFGEAHVEVVEHGQGMDTEAGIQMEKANRTEEADFGGLTPVQAEAISGAGWLLSGPPISDPQESGSESEQSALERSTGLKEEEVSKSSECKHALANTAVNYQLVSEGSEGAITLPENQCLPVLDVMHPVTELCSDSTSQQAAGERTPRSTGVPEEQPVTEGSVIKVSPSLCRTGPSLVGMKRKAGFLCTTEINMESADGEKMQCGEDHMEAEKFGQRMGNEPGLQIEEGAQTKQVDFGGLAAPDEPSTLAETISEALRLLPDAMIIPTPSFSDYEKYKSESRHLALDSRSSFKEEEGVKVSYDMHTPLNTVVYKELVANGNEAAVVLTESQSNPIPVTELSVDLTYRQGAGERIHCPPGSFDDQPAKDIRTVSVLPPLCRSDLSLMDMERVTHSRHKNEMNWKMTGGERVQSCDFEGGAYDDGRADGPMVKMGERAGTKEGYFEVLAASDVTATQSETLAEAQSPLPEPQIIPVPCNSHSEGSGVESEGVAVSGTSQCEGEKEASEKNYHQSLSSDDQPAEVDGVITVSLPLCRTGQSLKDMEREPDFPHSSEIKTDGEQVEYGEVEEFGQQMDNATGSPMREGTQTKETDLGLITVDSISAQGETISEAQRLLPDPVVIPVTCILDSQECKSESGQGALESAHSFKEENWVKASQDRHTFMENQVVANENRGAMMLSENHSLPKLDKKYPVMELTADLPCKQGAGERTFCLLGSSDGHSVKEQITIAVSPTFCRTGQPLEDEKSEADLPHTTTQSQPSFKETFSSHTQGTDVTNERCSSKTKTSEALKWAKTPIDTRMNTYLGFLDEEKDIESLPAVNFPTSEIKFLESMVSSLPPIKPDDSPETCYTPVPILPKLEHPKTENTATKEQLPHDVEIKIKKKGTKKKVMPTEAVSLPQEWDAGPTCNDRQNNLCSLTQGNKAPEKRHVGKFNKSKNERNSRKINGEIKDKSVDFDGVEVAVNQKRRATVLDSPAAESQPFKKCKKPQKKKLKTEVSEAGSQAVDSTDVNPEDKLVSLMDGGALPWVSNARTGVKTAEEPCQALTDSPLLETSVQSAAQPSVGSVAVTIEDEKKLIDLYPNYSNSTEYIETASKSTKTVLRVQGKKVKKTKAMGKKRARTKLVAEEECTEVKAASVGTVEDELEIHCKNETEMQTPQQASVAQEKASPVCLKENENILSPVNICHHNSQIHKTRKGRGAKRLKSRPLETHGSEVAIDPNPILEENLHQSPAAWTTCNDIESSHFQKSQCRKRTTQKNQKKSQALLKDLGSQETCLLIGKENGSANGGTVAAASNASAPNDTLPHNNKKCKSRKNKLGTNDAQNNLHIVSTVISDTLEPQNQMTLGLASEVKSEGILQTSSTKPRKRKCKNSKLISKVSPFASVEYKENTSEMKIPDPACSFLTLQSGGGEVSGTDVDGEVQANLRKQLKGRKVEAAAVTSKKERRLSPGERLEGFKVSKWVGKSKKNLGQQNKKKTRLKMENQSKLAEKPKKDERDGSSTEIRNDLVTLHISSRAPRRSKVKKINKLKQPLGSPVGSLTAVEHKDEYLPNDQNLPTLPASSTDPLLVQKGKISSPAGFSGPETQNVIETFQILKRTPKRRSRPLKTKMESQGINLKRKGKEPSLTVYKGFQEEKSASPTNVGVIKQQTHYHGKRIKRPIKSIQKDISHSVSQQALVSSTEIKNNLVGTSALSLKKNAKKPKKSRSTTTTITKVLMESAKNEMDMCLDTTRPIIPQQARRKVNMVLPVSRRGHKKMKKLKNKVIVPTSEVAEILEADVVCAGPKTGGTVKKKRRKTGRLCMKKKPKIKMAEEFAVEQGSTDLSNEQKLENQVNPQKVKKRRVKKVSKKVKTGFFSTVRHVGRFSRARRITAVDKVEPHCAPSSDESIFPTASDSTRRLNFPKQEISPASPVSLLSDKPQFVDDGRPQKRGKKRKGKICKRKGKGCLKQIMSVHEHHAGVSPVSSTSGTAELISNDGITHKVLEHDHSLKNYLQEEAAVIKGNSQKNVIENLSVQESSYVPVQALVQATEMKGCSTRTIEGLHQSVRKKIRKSRRPKCEISPEVMFANVEHGAEITQDGDDILIPKQSEDETNTQAGNGAQCHVRKGKVVKGDMKTQKLTLAEPNIVKDGLGILKTGGAVTKVKKRGRPFNKKTLAKMAKQFEFIEDHGSNVSEMAVNNAIENHGQPQDFSTNQPQACIQKKKRKIKLASPLTPVAQLRRYSRACKVTTDYTLDKIKDRLEYNLKLSSSAHVGDVLPSFPAMEIKEEILGSLESKRTLGTESPIASRNAAPSEMQSHPHRHSNIKTLQSNTVLNSSGDIKVEEDAALSTSLCQDPGLSQSSPEIVEFNGTDVITRKPLRSTGRRRSGKKRRRTWWDMRGKAKKLLSTTLGTAIETSHNEGRLGPALVEQIPHKMYTPDPKLLNPGQGILNTYSDSDVNKGQLHCFQSEKTDCDMAVGEGQLVNGENDRSENLEATGKMKIKNEELHETKGPEDQNIVLECSQNFAVPLNVCNSVGDSGTVGKLPQKSEKEMEEGITALTNTLTSEDPNLSQKPSSMKTPELSSGLNSTEDTKVHEETTTLLSLGSSMNPSFHNVLESDIANSVPKKLLKSIGRKRSGKRRRRSWWDERGKVKHLVSTTLDTAMEMSHDGGLEPAIGEQIPDVRMCDADKLQMHEKYSDSHVVGGQPFCFHSEKTDCDISVDESPSVNAGNNGSVDCKVLAKVSTKNEELKNCEVHEDQNIACRSSQDSKVDCSSMADNETVVKLPHNSGKEMEEVINASIDSVPSELQNISQEHFSMKTLELGNELNSTKDNKVREEAATFTTVLPVDPNMSPSFHKVFEPPGSHVVTKKPRKSVGRKRRGKMRRRTWWDERGKAKQLGLTTMNTAVETSYDGGGLEPALGEQIPEKEIYNANLELQALEKGIEEKCSDSDVNRGLLNCLISEKSDCDVSVGESSLVNGDKDGLDDGEAAAQMNITNEELKNPEVHNDQEVAPAFSQNSALSTRSCDSTRKPGTEGKLPQKFGKVMEEERNASTNTLPSGDQNLSQEPSCIKTLELSTKQNYAEDIKIHEDTTTSSTLLPLDPGMNASFDNVVEYNFTDVVTNPPWKSIGRRRNGKKRKRTWWDERGKAKGLLNMIHNSKNKIPEGTAASLLSQGKLDALSKEKRNTVEDLRPTAGLSNAQGRLKKSRHRKSKSASEPRVLRNRNREKIEPDTRGANFKLVDESESKCVVPHTALESKTQHTGNPDIEQNPLESESLAWKNALEETLSAKISNPGMGDLKGCTEMEEQSASIKDAQQGQLDIDMNDPPLSNAGSTSPSFSKSGDSQDSSISQQSGHETFGTDTGVRGAENIIKKSKTVKEEIINVKSTSVEPRETDNVLKIPQAGRAINNVTGKRGRPFKKKTLARKARNVPLIEGNCSEIAAISQPENYGESPEMSFHQPIACKQVKRTKKVKLMSPPTTQLRRYSRACKLTANYSFNKIKGDEHNINYSLLTHSSDTLPPHPSMDLKQEMAKSVETEGTLETDAQIVSSNNAPLREQKSFPEHASLETRTSSTELNSSEDIKVLEETTSFTKLSPLDPSKDPSCGIGLNSSSVVLKNPWKSIGRKRSGKKRRRSWWDERGKARKLLNTALVTAHNQGRWEPDLEEKATDDQMGNSESELLVLGEEVCEKKSDSIISGGQLLDFHSESIDCVISAGEDQFAYGENNSSEGHEAITKVNCRSQESSDLDISTEQDTAHAIGNNVTVLPNSCNSKGERETVDDFFPKKPEKENEASSSGKIENEILHLPNKKEDGKLEFDVISTEPKSSAGSKNPNVITNNNSSTALLNNSCSDDSQVFAEVEEKSVRDVQGDNMGIQMNNLPFLHTLQSSVSESVVLQETSHSLLGEHKTFGNVEQVSKGADVLLNNSVREDACVFSKDAQKDDLCSEMEGSHFSETYSPQSSETRNCKHEDRLKFDEEKRRNGKVQLLEDAEDCVGNNREIDAVEMTEEPILTANPPELPVSACLTVKNKFTAKCHFCGRAFRHITAYFKHRRIHTGEKPYMCRECGRTFAQLSHLNIHRKAHKLPGCLQCPLCTRKFSVRDKLLLHFLTHTDYLNQKKMIGESVHDGAGIEVKINNHLLKSSFSMQNVKPFHCTNCGKYFHYGASLRWHACIQREKPFSCSVCDKAFSKASKLSDHEKIHWPVKPFACSICGKGFCKLGALKMHSRTHTGETPFSCVHCGDAFLLLSSLRKHQASKVCLSEEMSERGSNGCVDDLVALQSQVGQENASVSFQCVVCRKSFSKLAEYSRHLLTHTDIQPSVCDACGQKFNKSSNLHAHRQICCILSGSESLKRSSVSNEPQLHHSRPDQSPEHNPPENQLQTSGSLLQKGSQSAELLEMHPTSRAASSSVRATASRSVGSCQEPFKSPWKFKAHMSTSAPRYSYTCGRCGKALENWSKYWLHQRVHWQKPGGFYCPHCGKKFHFHGLYKEHMLKHAKQNPYACPVCPIAFADKERLVGHQEEAHKACKTQKCPTCGKRFINLTNMEKHKLLHKVVHPRRHCFANRFFLRSSVPPSLFATNSSNLPLSDTPAEVISLHRCEECGVTFSSLDFLAIHQLCHSTRDVNTEKDREILVGSLSLEHQRLPQSPSSPTPLLSSSPRDTGDQPASLYAHQHPDDLYVYPTPSTSFPPPVLPYITNVFSYRNASQTNPSAVTTPEPFGWCDYNRFPVDNLQVLSEHLYAAPPPVSSSGAGPPVRPPQPHPDKLSGHSSRVHAPPKAQVHQIQFICSEDLARTLFNVPSSFVKLRNKAELEESLECAECRTEFGAIEELYEHYIEHARGEL